MQNIPKQDSVSNQEKLKFIRLACNKCRNVVSKNYTLKEKFKIERNEEKKKEFYISKLIYFKSIYLSNKTKIKNKIENVFLYQQVKCVQCGKKIGMFVKSAAGKSFDHIDSVLFTPNNLTIEEFEKEPDHEIEGLLKNIKNSENILKLKDKERLIKIFKNSIDDTNQKLSDLDLFFENIVSDFQNYLDKIEEIKIILLNMWNKVKDKKENNLKDGFTDNITRLLSGVKDITAAPNIKKIEEDVSKDESHFEQKLDFSGLDNEKNYNKNKSFLGQNYKDQKINFPIIEKIDSNNNIEISLNQESLKKNNAIIKKKSTSKIK